MTTATVPQIEATGPILTLDRSRARRARRAAVRYARHRAELLSAAVYRRPRLAVVAPPAAFVLVLSATLGITALVGGAL